MVEVERQIPKRKCGELAKEGETIGKSLRSWQGGNITQLPTYCAPDITQLPTYCAPETGKHIVRKTGVGVRRPPETRM
jgi:hypothetical protein